MFEQPGQMPRRRNVIPFFAALFFLGAASGQTVMAQTGASHPPVRLDDDGTLNISEMGVPVSGFLSPEGKAYMADHLKQVRRPAMLVQDNGVPPLLAGFIARQKRLFPTDMQDTKIAGVHAYIYTPKDGISRASQRRILINLHGGGFTGCFPGCAELESMPVAALEHIKVVSLDYREGPDHRFPAASEDVAAVYRELLKTYPASNIGIYGCSAGGMLTAMSVAWFQTHALPRPGAIGILCAGAAADFAGDAGYTGIALGEGRTPPAPPPKGAAPKPQTGYFANADPNDPLVSPNVSPATLKQFPPTLVITTTRGFDMSSAVYTHTQLVKAGVDAELHVWEGMFHGFFYNPDVPESREVFDVIATFFDRHLGKRPEGLHAK